MRRRSISIRWAARRLGNTAVIALEGEPGDWRLVSWDDGVLLDLHSVT